MRIALVYNEPLPSRYQALGEGVAIASVLDAVEAVTGALVANGHAVRVLGVRPPISQAIPALRDTPGDLVFNLFEGFAGAPDSEWQWARELRLLGRPFTGAAAPVLALCLNKARTKALLEVQGIPTPPFQLLRPLNVEEFDLGFPVIVKPLKEDASHGLGPRSVVEDAPSLAQRVRTVAEEYGGPALVERFLPGREFNVSILGGQPCRVLPPSEIVYAQGTPGPRILTYAAKWLPQDPAYQATTPVCPAQAPESLLLGIKGLAVAAYQAVGSPPYARVDLRSDGQDRLYILEVNPNPDLSPEAGLALQARASGVEYRQLVEAIAELALRSERPPGIGLRPMRPEEVPELVRITADTGFFRPEEVEVAGEVLKEAAAKGEDSDYRVWVATGAPEVLGYVCFGPTPLTRGTWDIYWLAVDPPQQRRGVGRLLMGLAEEEIFLAEGRLILVETSSQQQYEPTRKFYRALGYREVSRIPDFYAPGDAKVTFAKVWPQGGDRTMTG